MGNVFEFFKCSLGEEEKICEKVVIYGLLKRIFNLKQWKLSKYFM